MMRDLALARTFLFVPGDRPDRFGKAAGCGADIVILDLEDAVAADRKHEAREHVRAWLDQRHEAVVRVNAADTPWHAGDIDMVAGSPGAIAVMVPKAEDPRRIESLSRRLPAGTGTVPLIETAAGLLGATAICALGPVVRPAFGSVDLAAQLGVDHNAHHALHHMRSALVLAAAAAGCGAPVDGVTTSLADDSRLHADLEHAIALGFTAKLCIHPRQVAIANQRLTPSAADVEWARQVIAAAQDGAVTVRDGQMIDRPVILRAQAILARASSAIQEGQAL
jgi:citrate lyase subunit beta / citryl-CoA lyase